MIFTVAYVEYIEYLETIEASSPDEASEIFINKLMENSIEPELMEIDTFEIAEGGGYDGTKEREPSSWATNHQY